MLSVDSSTVVTMGYCLCCRRTVRLEANLLRLSEIWSSSHGLEYVVVQLLPTDPCINFRLGTTEY